LSSRCRLLCPFAAHLHSLWGRQSCSLFQAALSGLARAFAPHPAPAESLATVRIGCTRIAERSRESQVSGIGLPACGRLGVPGPGHRRQNKALCQGSASGRRPKLRCSVAIPNAKVIATHEETKQTTEANSQSRTSRAFASPHGTRRQRPRQRPNADFSVAIVARSVLIICGSSLVAPTAVILQAAGEVIERIPSSRAARGPFRAGHP